MNKLDFKTHMQTNQWYDSLDCGIRFAVKVLHANGVETGQSCEGGNGHAYNHPTIDLLPSPISTGAGYKALAALTQVDLPVFRLAYNYNIQNGLPVVGFWRIEFSKTMFERENDWPMFVHGYYCDSRGC